MYQSIYLKSFQIKLYVEEKYIAIYSDWSAHCTNLIDYEQKEHLSKIIFSD